MFAMRQRGSTQVPVVGDEGDERSDVTYDNALVFLFSPFARVLLLYFISPRRYAGTQGRYDCYFVHVQGRPSTYVLMMRRL